MTDLICRKTMKRCQTPGMCSTHGGCQPSNQVDTNVRYSSSSGVAVLHAGGVVSRDQVEAFKVMEAAIIQAIATAYAAGVPRGLVVALLHGQAHLHTYQMIGAAQ